VGLDKVKEEEKREKTGNPKEKETAKKIRVTQCASHHEVTKAGISNFFQNDSIFLKKFRFESSTIGHSKDLLAASCIIQAQHLHTNGTQHQLSVNG